MRLAETRDYPFWDWFDAAVLALLAIPTLLVGGFIGLGVGRMVRDAGALTSWIAMLVFYALWFGCLYLVLKTKYNRPFWPSLAWKYPAPGWMLSIIAGPALAIAVGVLGALLKTPQSDLPIRKMLHGPLAIPLFGVFSVILGPLTEELAFRGFFLPLFIRSFGPAVGIVLTALPFALLHGPEYNWTWQYVLLIGAAGAAFGWVRYRSGSTFNSAVMHSTYNLTFFAGLLMNRTAL
ncbi:MAG TPA: type II CAAX endopeptidase family protein [Bryobacteraceae bacterium]|jgi:membrane protease YdiL (CAAX protease family)|nr:type II CAAX endopeptidase family protein [Bryobacteraceae bacterium]